MESIVLSALLLQPAPAQCPVAGLRAHCPEPYYSAFDLAFLLSSPMLLSKSTFFPGPFPWGKWNSSVMTNLCCEASSVFHLWNPEAALTHLHFCGGESMVSSPAVTLVLRSAMPVPLFTPDTVHSGQRVPVSEQPAPHLDAGFLVLWVMGTGRTGGSTSIGHHYLWPVALATIIQLLDHSQPPHFKKLKWVEGFVSFDVVSCYNCSSVMMHLSLQACTWLEVFFWGESKHLGNITPVFIFMTGITWG